MKLVAPFAILASLVAASVAQDDFTVSVADHTQCASTVITWENGVGPYQVLAWIAHNGASVPVIVTGGIVGTSYPLLNDAEAGYVVEVEVSENNGHTAQVQYTIEPSSNTTCLPGVGWTR